MDREKKIAPLNKKSTVLDDLRIDVLGMEEYNRDSSIRLL